MESVNQLRSQFADPPNWYRPAPFWFWNHDLKEGEIRRQVRLMHEQGIGGFFMHARYGRITPYLSEEWHCMIGAAVDEARKWKMHAWLYDEDNWPSGSAGGQTVRENYRFASSHLKPFAETIIEGPGKLDIELPSEGEFEIAYAIPIGNNVVSVPDGVLALGDAVAHGRLRAELPAGKWLVLAFQRYFHTVGFNSVGVDTFNRAGIARFIELTHKAYKDRFGGDFGELIPGIFFDEISMNYGRALIPWTDGLLEQFEAGMGYDFTKYIPALLYDVGDKTTKYRADFYGFLTRLYSEATLKQIYDFCDACGLRSTGHFNREDFLPWLAREQGNFFTLAKYTHIPGIDHLGDCTWPIAFSAKVASSAAHLLDKERTMCESFGLAKGWAISIKDIKRLGDCELALGINLIVPHAVYYSIQGQRKWECIPNHFYQTAFWPYYRLFCDHSARTALMLSAGMHVARIAVYCPFESMHVNDWTGLSERKDLSRFDYYDARARRTERDVHELTQALLSGHHDFDFMDSDLLASAHIENGRLVVKGDDGEALESFKCVILPSATTVPHAVIRKLEKFAGAGGIVLAAGLLPVESTKNGRDPGIPDAARRLFGADPLEVEAAILQGKDPGAGDRYLGAPASWLEDAARKMLDSKLESLVGRDVSITADGEQAREIVCYHTALADGDIYFLANISPTESCDALVTLSGAGVPVYLDTQTGDFGLPLEYSVKDGSLEIPLSFAPGQSHMIALLPPGAKANPGRAANRRPGKPAEAVELPDVWRFRPERGNALPIKDWKIELEVGRKNMFGFQSLLRRYTASFRVKDLPASARLLLDGVSPFDRMHSRCRVWVNDDEIAALEEGRYLDRLIGEADVAGFLKEGENTVRIEITSIFDEAAYLGHIAYLIGDFALEQSDGDWALVKPRTQMPTGSWSENGYPFYSGACVYEQDFEVPERWAGKTIALKLDEVSDLADVSINSQNAGVLAWDPLELDITRHVRPGRNMLTIKVVNSMSNLIALEPIKSGLTGKVRIEVYLGS